VSFIADCAVQIRPVIANTAWRQQASVVREMTQFGDMQFTGPGDKRGSFRYRSSFEARAITPLLTAGTAQKTCASMVKSLTLVDSGAYRRKVEMLTFA
jgi:hypothetical protein